MPLPDLSQFTATPPAQSDLPDLNQFVEQPEQIHRAHDTRPDLRQFVPTVDGRGLADEFLSGISGGVDNLQMTLFGVAGLAGRELGIKTLEDFGIAGAERNVVEAQASGRESGGFSDIESAGGFFKWAAASLGEALPSLGLAIAGGGVGGVLAKKAVEAGIRRSLTNRITRDLMRRGFSADDAAEAAVRNMASRSGERFLTQSVVRGKSSSEVLATAFRRGQIGGAAGVSTPPQTGAIDLELQEAGIDAGFTAVMGGVLGGALEALPALRLMDKMFPGVDQRVAKGFVKDFAVATGTQAALEGTTEAAQEMIQLAAMAYHDPSFDLMDPANAKRVIDAFAAGAIVGAVTGGGAESIGAVTSGKKRPPRKFEKPPELEEFAVDDDTDKYPEGFDPADNTLFEEVRGRILGVVAPMIEPAINSLSGAAKQAFNALDSDMGGGMHREATKLSQVIKDAHNKFVETHAAELGQLKEYVKNKSAEIYSIAETFTDPEKRSQFIEEEMESVRARVEGLSNKLKERAAQRDEQTSAEVDNMDLSGILDDLDFATADTTEQTENLRAVAPEDEVVAAPGETDAPPITIFGLNQKQPTIDVSGEQTVQGYDEASLEKGLDNLRRKFPDANEDSFRVITQEDGTFLIEVIDPNLRDDLKFWNDFDAARASGRKKRDSNLVVEIEGVDGHSFGYGFKKFLIDVQQMAYKGLNLVPKSEQRGQMTMEQGFLTFASELLSRGVINNEQFKQLRERALGEERLPGDPVDPDAGRGVLKKSKDDPIPQFSDPPQFTSRVGAERVMNEFITHLKSLGFTLPRSLFVVSKQADSNLWTFGFNQENPTAMRRFQTKYGRKFMQFKEELRKFRGDARRRSETLDQATQDENAFSGNQVLEGPSTRGTEAGGQRNLQFGNDPTSSGDLGDRTGVTAGSPDVTVGPTFGQRGTVEDPFQESRDTRAQTQDGEPAPQLGAQRSFAEETGGFGLRPADNTNQSVAPSLEESRESQQATDLATDPKELESEFADRAEELRRTSRRSNKETRHGEMTKRDQALLKRWGRKGSVKMMLGDTAAATTKALTELTNFVTRTLGLSNQITVMDDTGLRLLIEQGLVSDPVFEQTLNDPNVHARNIRINDNSFVYLSPKLLSDPVAATLAFGHEMGHHVYRVAWDKLTPAAQARLRKAFESTRGKTKPNPRDAELLKVTDAKLQGWKDFVVKEKARIAKLPSMDQRLESQNESRHQTESGIAEVEAARDRAAGKGKGTDAEFNEWMADQLAAWISQPRLPQGAAEGFFAKVGGQIRRLYDFIKKNPRFELNETFKQFADAVALQAKSSAGQQTNPYNEAQLKAWFRNEGVTMYAWFGEAMLGKDEKPVKTPRGAKTTPRTSEVDNMAFDFAPVTAEGKKALARVEKNYPAIAKRAVTLRNWMTKAYDLVLAPSTGVIRAMPYKSAQTLVRIFNRQEQGEARKGQNYPQAVRLMQNQFAGRYTALTKGMTDVGKRRLAKSLQKKDGDLNATFTKREQQIRDLFDEMHAYATEAGLPVNRIINYWPRTYDRDLLVAGKAEIIAHLMANRNKGDTLSDVNRRYNSLIDPNANEGRATRDATETPGFNAMNSRAVMGPFFDQFLDANPDTVVTNYISQVVKRVEFNKRLGSKWNAGDMDIRKAIRDGAWDPKKKMHDLLDVARADGATETEITTMEMYIDANLGQLGRDSISPGTRKFIAGVMAYQNMRVLLFTVFASLPDGVGPAIRAGSMRLHFDAIKNNFHDIMHDTGKLSEMARALGVVQDAAVEHVMMEYVDNHHMPPVMRKWNEKFFQYTGLNWYTNFTRRMALATGIDYIQQSYNDSQLKVPKGTTGDAAAKIERKAARGKDMLAELGMTVENAKSWIDAGKPTYDSQSHDMTGSERKAAEALIQFVDESIMRPNASQRPILASHPAAALVFHLKGYMYAVNDIILKRLKFNLDEAQGPAEISQAIAPAIAMMLLTAVGLELRELIQYAGSNRKPPTDRMDGWDYTWELFQRSGLTGVTQIGFDFEGAEDRGITKAAGVLGPTMSQVGSFLSKPVTQTIPQAIPVIGQIPAARSIVRDVVQ